MVDAKLADEVYDKIKSQLKGQEGKMVAIEVESGDFFVGKNTIEAYDKAHKKFPDKQFFFKRVGAKAAYFVGAI